MSARPTPPSECAQCGEPIPPGARACPGCGADERTGWRETSVYDGLELPDTLDDDDADSSGHSGRPFSGLAWYWWCLAVALLLVLGLGWLGLR